MFLFCRWLRRHHWVYLGADCWACERCGRYVGPEGYGYGGNR